MKAELDAIGVGRLLLIENDQDWIESVKTELKDHFEISVAQNSEDALEMINDFEPDAIIMDWAIPSMGGRDLCLILRDRDELEFVPILVLSTSDNLLTRTFVYQSGADDFMVKPVSSAEILRKIGALIRTQSFSRNLEKSLANRGNSAPKIAPTGPSKSQFDWD